MYGSYHCGIYYDDIVCYTTDDEGYHYLDEDHEFLEVCRDLETVYSCEIVASVSFRSI